MSITANRTTLFAATMAIVAAILILPADAPSQVPAEGLPHDANVDPSLKPRDAYTNGTYTNKDFGFRLSIPKKGGWKGYANPDIANVIFVAMKESRAAEKKWVDGVSFRPNVTLGVEIVPPGVDTKTYAAAATKALELAGWQLMEERNVQWGGREGYEIRARRDRDNVALLQRFTVLRGGAIVIASTARPKQMKTVEKDFRSIFESFKVIDQTTRAPKKRKRRKKR